jgi:hypothetical protein
MSISALEPPTTQPKVSKVPPIDPGLRTKSEKLAAAAAEALVQKVVERGEPAVVFYYNVDGKLQVKSVNGAPIVGVSDLKQLSSLSLEGRVQSAGFSNWNNVYLDQGSTYDIYFYPWKKGNHSIEFANDSDYYHAGHMESCWNYDGDQWRCWAVSDVLSTIRSQNLYSGHADVAYRFQFDAAHASKNFWWRFYTCDWPWY